MSPWCRTPALAILALGCERSGPSDPPAAASGCATLQVIAPGERLHDALAQATPGSCIHLGAGRHVLRSTATIDRSGEPGAPIVLAAQGDAIIDGSAIADGPTLAVAANHVIVRGLAFEGTPTVGEHNVVVIEGDEGRHGRGVVLRDCVVTGGHDQLKIRGMATGVLVESCEFHGAFGHIPISITGAQALTIRNNVFHDWHADDDGALQIKGGSRQVRVEANLFRDIGGPAGALALGDGCGASCDHDPEHYAAREIVAAHNRFERVARPFDVLGCRSCLLLHNVMVGCGYETAAIKLGVAETNGAQRASLDTRVIGNRFVAAGVPADALVQVVGDAARGLTWAANFLDTHPLGRPQG